MFVIRSLIVIGCMISLTASPIGVTVSQDTRETMINSAIEKLWSPNDLERELGKKQILELGAISIKPLASCLLDLLMNQSPRFPKGREEAGMRALDYCRELSKRPMSSEEINESVELITNLFINSRLIHDVVYLMGELRAEEAIPILIKIMERRDMYSEPDGYGFELEALHKIGSSAVPYLMAAIREARVTAKEQNDMLIGCVMHLGESGVTLRREEESQRITYEETDEEDEEEINARFYKIQKRAVTVLGSIGDESALPFLRKLAQETVDERLIHHIRAVISRIENRGNPETSVRSAESAGPKDKCPRSAL